MQIYVFSPGEDWGGALMDRFAAGCAARGHSVGIRYPGAWRKNEYEPCDCAALIGLDSTVLTIFEEYRRHDVPVLLISDGFIMRTGDRMKRYWAVGKNGFHARADQVSFMVPGDRWQALNVRLKPWKTTGKNIVIAHQFAQVPYYGEHKKEAFPPAIAELQNHTDRPIVFRTHPLEKHWKRTETETPSGCIESTAHTFAEELENAWAVVTYDSNAALEAMIAGVPVFTLGQSMIDACANKDLSKIESPLRPDRQQLMHWIAYTQYNPDEFKAGLPCKILIENDYALVSEAATESAHLCPVVHSGEPGPVGIPDEPVKVQVTEQPTQAKTGEVSKIRLASGETVDKLDLEAKLATMKKNYLVRFADDNYVPVNERHKVAELRVEICEYLFRQE